MMKNGKYNQDKTEMDFKGFTDADVGDWNPVSSFKGSIEAGSIFRGFTAAELAKSKPKYIDYLMSHYGSKETTTTKAS